MAKNPSCVSRKNGTHEASRAKGSRKSRYPEPGEEDGGDLIECSGKNCPSCTAGLIADCVAVCCCPCAVLSLLALALVRVPWMVGRRCLGFGKRKGRKLETERKCERNESDRVLETDEGSRKGKAEECESQISSMVGGEERTDDSFGRSEAERVWLELHDQVGHLGFGRVSFSGSQSLCRGN